MNISAGVLGQLPPRKITPSNPNPNPNPNPNRAGWGGGGQFSRHHLLANTYSKVSNKNINELTLNQKRLQESDDQVCFVIFFRFTYFIFFSQNGLKTFLLNSADSAEFNIKPKIRQVIKSLIISSWQQLGFLSKISVPCTLTYLVRSVVRLHYFLV